MGGKAFIAPPHSLTTPRLPPALYHSLSANILSLLTPLYTHVLIPLPAPQKSSYGDIDVLVSLPHDPRKTTPQALTSVLKAAANVKSGGVRSFAVPYPEQEGWHVQVDIQQCGAGRFEWSLMMASHGDFWNILGTSLHRCGLTANDVGLHVRAEEIEGENKRRSLVFLSADAGAVLRFLGVEEEGFWRGYGTEVGMWGEVCRCRVFRPRAYRREGMRASERKRWEQRAGYRGFVEWVTGGGEGEQNGGHEGKGEGREALTRKGVLEEALEVFGKRVEYRKRVEVWSRERDGLVKRQGAKEERKSRAVEEGDYADAWVGWLNGAQWARGWSP